MQGRVLLVLAFGVLFVGLAAWALVAGGTARDDPRVPETFLPQPPIGEPPRDGDARASAARTALEAARLPSSRVVRLGVRDEVPLFGIAVPARDALRVFDSLLSLRERTGLRPVLLGDGRAVLTHDEAMRTTSDPPAAILRRAEAIDVDAWVREHSPETAVAAPGTHRDASGDPRERFLAIGDAMFELPVREIGVALVPVARGADAIAHLAFGNWRGCPEPTVHVAILRALEERAGAELVVVTSDRIELRVERAPADASEREALARLLVAYAPTLLVRANGSARSLDEVAAEVVPSRVWSLRWPRS